MFRSVVATTPAHTQGTISTKTIPKFVENSFGGCPILVVGGLSNESRFRPNHLKIQNQENTEIAAGAGGGGLGVTLVTCGHQLHTHASSPCPAPLVAGVT